MKLTTERIEDITDLAALTTIISESYVASYPGSSLKVRRRYRRLITILKKAEKVTMAETQQTTYSSALKTPAQDSLDQAVALRQHRWDLPGMSLVRR